MYFKVLRWHPRYPASVMSSLQTARCKTQLRFIQQLSSEGSVCIHTASSLHPAGNKDAAAPKPKFAMIVRNSNHIQEFSTTATRFQRLVDQELTTPVSSRRVSYSQPLLVQVPLIPLIPHTRGSQSPSRPTRLRLAWRPRCSAPTGYSTGAPRGATRSTTR